MTGGNSGLGLRTAIALGTAAEGARVVTLTSLGHRCSPVVFDDINFEIRPYDPWLGYGQSKTAMSLFAVELDRRGQGDGVWAFAAHPGSIVATGLKQYLSTEELVAAGTANPDGSPILDPAKQLTTPEQGAATPVWCATSAELAGLGGVYCEKQGVDRPGGVRPDRPTHFARRPAAVSGSPVS